MATVASQTPPEEPLEIQVAMLTTAVITLAGVLANYLLPGVIDVDATKVRERLAAIHTQLNRQEDAKNRR